MIVAINALSTALTGGAPSTTTSPGGASACGSGAAMITLAQHSLTQSPLAYSATSTAGSNMMDHATTTEQRPWAAQPAGNADTNPAKHTRPNKASGGGADRSGN